MSKLKYELTHYISPWMAIFTALIALASIAYLPFVIAAVIFGVATGLAYSVEKDDRTRHAAFSAIDEPKPTKDRFCSDCGKEFILKSYQDGFDPKNGKPVMRSYTECPNREAAEKAYRASSSGYRSDYPSGPRCGERPRGIPTSSSSLTTLFASLTAVPSSMSAHTHKDPTELKTDCPSCVGTMLDNGAIDLETAQKLLSA